MATKEARSNEVKQSDLEQRVALLERATQTNLARVKEIDHLREESSLLEVDIERLTKEIGAYSKSEHELVKLTKERDEIEHTIKSKEQNGERIAKSKMFEYNKALLDKNEIIERHTLARKDLVAQRSNMAQRRDAIRNRIIALEARIKDFMDTKAEAFGN